MLKRPAYKCPVVEVSCSDCGVSWFKNERSIAEWKGRCGSCAVKLNHPEGPSRKYHELPCLGCGVMLTRQTAIKSARCSPCTKTRNQEQYQERNRVLVTCKTCPATWLKSSQTIEEWNGNCRSCAQKEVAADPAFKAKRADTSRRQVLAQGGIPNSHRFTSEDVKGENNVNWRHERRGAEAPNWKGGIHPVTKSIRTSLKYIEWRKSIMERDDFTCLICRQRGGRLHVDHFPMPFSKLFAAFQELDISADNFAPFWDTDNGRTLCEKCHREFGWNVSWDKKPKVALTLVA